MSAYCAAKAGLSMLTQMAAMEMAARGIRVNAIAPGFVHTALTEAAAAVPGASWLTGEVLDLNGGAHLMRYPDVFGHIMNWRGRNDFRRQASHRHGRWLPGSAPRCARR
jgi:3-oxoacyl-[acyl-carrier protein] reductase